MAEARASVAVGRPVHIEHLHVKLGRVPTVTAEALRVSNPSGFPDDPPFAQVRRRATAQVEISASLRSREVVVSSVELNQPVVNVICRDDSSRNYEFNFAAPTGEGAEASKAPRPPFMFWGRIPVPHGGRPG